MLFQTFMMLYFNVEHKNRIFEEIPQKAPKYIKNKLHKKHHKSSSCDFIYISYYLEFQLKSSAVLSLLTKINYWKSFLLNKIKLDIHNRWKTWNVALATDLNIRSLHISTKITKIKLCINKNVLKKYM